MSQKAEFIKNLSLPVIAAPMFLISGPKLVVECCKNGIVGTFPALNQRTSDGFEEWLIQIKSELKAFEEETGKKAAPFGVNLVVHPTNPRLRRQTARLRGGTRTHFQMHPVYGQLMIILLRKPHKEKKKQEKNERKRKKKTI